MLLGKGRARVRNKTLCTALPGMKATAHACSTGTGAGAAANRPEDDAHGHHDGAEGPSAESGALGGVVRGGSQVAAAKMRVGAQVQGSIQRSGWRSLWRGGKAKIPSGKVSKVADLADNAVAAVEEIAEANVEGGRNAGVADTVKRAAPSLLRSVVHGTVLFLTYENVQARLEASLDSSMGVAPWHPSKAVEHGQRNNGGGPAEAHAYSKPSHVLAHSLTGAGGGVVAGCASGTFSLLCDSLVVRVAGMTAGCCARVMGANVAGHASIFGT